MLNLVRLTTATVLVVSAGCAVEAAPQPAVRRGSTSSQETPTPAPGATNQNGEHGSAKPAGPDQTPALGTSVGNEQWADGKTIAANLTIAAGATVEINPGAVVTLGSNVAITIKGTLKVSSAAQHAKLTSTASWVGIVVAQGGSLVVDGLDIEKAANAIWTQTGNAAATVQNGIIDAQTPFKMEVGSKLSIVKTKVKASAGSAMAGTFTASYMEYDKTTASGLTLNDPAGSMTFTDSILKGAGGGDYVISSAGKLVKLEYTVVSGSHCGLHFSGVDQYSLDHVSLDQNSYGAMLYGSGAGPNSITASNVQGTEYNLDMNGTNGPLTIDGSYLAPAAKTVGTPDPTNAAADRLADAQPRSL
jgi:hypothetical protein